VLISATSIGVAQGQFESKVSSSESARVGFGHAGHGSDHVELAAEPRETRRASAPLSARRIGAFRGGIILLISLGDMAAYFALRRSVVKAHKCGLLWVKDEGWETDPWFTALAGMTRLSSAANKNPAE
jgi:hypothetical protein